MAVSRKNPGERYARHALRKGMRRNPERTRIIITVSAVTLAVIILALVWGNALKVASDERRAAEEKGEWLLDGQIAVPIPVSVPDISAGFALPGGKMQGSELLSLSAVTFDLGDVSSPLPYALELPASSGMTILDNAPALSGEVKRFKNAGFYVIGVFTVTSLNSTDISEQILRRGQEMALLSLFAQAGIDDILLLGLPAGTDALDLAATDYLKEAEATLASTPASVPALGVSLYPAAFADGTLNEDGDIVYVGSLTPGRMLAVCDYLALDLRGYGEQADLLLKDMQYAYVRYHLRLLTSESELLPTEAAVRHGFDRVLMFGK